MKTLCNPFVETQEGKNIALAMSAMNAPVSEVIEHKRSHPAGDLDIALTAMLEAKRLEMIHGG